jgi:hypothetical protein
MAQKILKPSRLLSAFLDVPPHALFHFRIVFQPTDLTFKQLNRLIFDRVLISQAGDVDVLRPIGFSIHQELHG